VDGALVGRQISHVHVETGPSDASPCRDLYPGAVTGPKAPQGAGVAVRQVGFRVTGQHRGHPAPGPGQHLVTDGVHAAVHYVQPAGAQAVTNGVGAEAEPGQLRPRHDTVLPRRECRDLGVHVPTCKLGAYVTPFSHLGRHEPRLTAGM
jgi:hypothetical protein